MQSQKQIRGARNRYAELRNKDVSANNTYAVPSVQVLFATWIFISVDVYFSSSLHIFLKLHIFFS